MDDHRVARGVDWLRRAQEEDGSWYGRWGVNYIYGTWSVLWGLSEVGENMTRPYVRRAVEWLREMQKEDGGWGETVASYWEPELKWVGDSTPSQTAWALLGLMAAGEVGSEVVRRGVHHLVETQTEAGTWEERYWTGTGFPRVFYLKYNYYRHYFPLMALGQYRRLTGRDD
jgi:squalene-hopene/tetraprenyl-beta-curcumene cyclase